MLCWRIFFSLECVLIGSTIPNIILIYECKSNIGSSAVDGKKFLESNASSIPGTYFRLGYVMVPRIEEAFDPTNLLPSTALDPQKLSKQLKNDFLITKYL